MGHPVYSTRFMSTYVSSAATATAARYTVPAGKVAVIRSIDIWSYTAGTMLFGRVTSNDVIVIRSSAGMPAGYSATWEGHQVFTAGEIMGCAWVAGSHNVTVSGFLLTQL